MSHGSPAPCGGQRWTVPRRGYSHSPSQVFPGELPGTAMAAPWEVGWFDLTLTHDPGGNPGIDESGEQESLCSAMGFGKRRPRDGKLNEGGGEVSEVLEFHLERIIIVQSVVNTALRDSNNYRDECIWSLFLSVRWPQSDKK